MNRARRRILIHTPGLRLVRPDAGAAAKIP